MLSTLSLPKKTMRMLTIANCAKLNSASCFPFPLGKEEETITPGGRDAVRRSLLSVECRAVLVLNARFLSSLVVARFSPK